MKTKDIKQIEEELNISHAEYLKLFPNSTWPKQKDLLVFNKKILQKYGLDIT
jgi:hypothetical protein